jgi:hypothetical protein
MRGSSFTPPIRHRVMALNDRDGLHLVLLLGYFRVEHDDFLPYPCHFVIHGYSPVVNVAYTSDAGHQTRGPVLPFVQLSHRSYSDYRMWLGSELNNFLNFQNFLRYESYG